MNSKIFITSLCLLSSLSAQQGKMIYQTYCSACHGNNGEGRKGAAPALAQSSWVNGDPLIISKVLLHGVQGPITLHGETLELVMPAQSLLDDKQMADVASYVRNQWGNKADPISDEFIRKTREETKNQNGVINSLHFKRPFDLKDHTFKLKNLLSAEYPYTTNFDSLEKLTPKAIEEEKSGFMDPAQIKDPKHSFTGKWTGLVEIPKAGEYDFSFGTDDAARISVDGKVILERSKGEEPSVGSIKLEKKAVELEVYYAHKAKTPTFFRFFMSGPEMNMFRVHNMSKEKKAAPNIINPTADRALVHRNFLVKGGERSLAVGLPQEVNLYFSTQHMRLMQVWSGKFLDVSATWDGRAKGKITKPLGKALSVMKKGEVFKQSDGKITNWKDKGLKPVDDQFEGYYFDKAGFPVLRYTAGDYKFSDHFSAEKGVKSLVRKVDIKSEKRVDSNMYWKLLEGAKKVSDYSFKTESGVTLKISTSTNKPILLGDDLVMQITKPTTITLEYAWE